MSAQDNPAEDGLVPLLETSRVCEDMGIDAEGYAELVDIFLEDLPALRTAIASVTADDLDSFARQCHELCTTLGVIGASRAMLASRRIERDLRSGVKIDLGLATAGLLRELDTVAGLLAADFSGQKR